MVASLLTQLAVLLVGKYDEVNCGCECEQYTHAPVEGSMTARVLGVGVEWDSSKYGSYGRLFSGIVKVA